MRVMLVGQKWLGAETLALLRTEGCEVTQVAAPANDRLAVVAVENGIPCGDPGPTLPAAWVPEGTDLIVAAHAHCFVTGGARARARLGAIGYHPSLLPRHRGRDAVRWAVHMEERVTGGTVYWMDDRADGGPIAAQDWCFVRPGDDAASLWRRDLAPMGLRLFRQVLTDLRAGVVHREQQDESVATWEPSFDRPALRSASKR
ncbi:formyltransferase family protein [Lysobacter sp. CA199]|uniref:formyltransferase family protein n=1 Tax=Lysobacter sp. CA199 TaxID=3455608 RepID=UPI003F8D47E6